MGPVSSVIRTRAVCFGAAVLAATVLTDVTPASAHAVLLEANPPDGAVLSAAPHDITLRFNEDVTPVFVRVLDAAGHPVATPPPAAQDETVHLALPAKLADGSYVVSYRVISADTHPVGASLVFAVGPSGTIVGAAPASPPQEQNWILLATSDRALFDMAFLVAVGGGLFLLLVPRAGTSRLWIAVAAVVAGVTAVLGWGFEGGLATEAPLGDLADLATWRAGMTTGLGPSVGLTVVGLGLLLAGVASRVPRRALVLTGAGLAAAGYAVSGHVATASPRWLTAPALWLHVIFGAFWVGSLVPLMQILRRDGAGAADAVGRFSRVAIPAVTLLALAGAAMAFVQLDAWRDFIVTSYGLRLVVKLGLVAALLAVAAANRLVLTPAIRRAQPMAALWLQRSIAAELILVAAIVAVTATLGAATPPRALAEQEEHAHHLVGAGGEGYLVAVAQSGLFAYIAVDPAKPGLNRLSVELFDADAAPLKAREVTLSLADSALGIEPSQHALTATAGSYELTSLMIPASGIWTARVAALVSDFDERVVTTEITIR